MSDQLPEPGPAFPEWLREWDPLLEEEDCNPIYEAFRRRRALYPPPLARRIWTNWRVPVFETIVYVGILFGAAWAAINLPFLAVLPILFVVGIAGYATRALAEERIAPNVLPDRLTTIMRPSSDARMPLLDIALAGASTREILVAMYLEWREDSWMRQSVAVALSAAVPIILYSMGGEPASARGAFLLAGIGVLAWKSLEATAVASIGRFGRDRVPRLVRAWRGEFSLIHQWGFFKGLTKMEFLSAIPAAVVMVVVCLSLILLLYSSGAVGVGTRANPVTLGEMGYPMEVPIGMCCYVSAYAIHLYNSMTRRRHLTDFENRVSDARAALADFLDRTFERQ